VPDPYAVDAEYYDLIHGSFEADIGLWLSFAGRTDRPVLEAGCGTGRIALALAAAGHAVTGIDPSAAMLARARENADERALEVAFFEGRVTDLAIEQGHYGLALLPLDVFLYSAGVDEQLAILEALADCLDYNGLLVLDLPGPAAWLDPAENGRALLAWSGALPDGGTLDAWHLHEDDLATQTRTLRLSYELTGPDGLVRRRQSEHRLRYVYPAEMEHLLVRAGLVLAGRYGGYDLESFTTGSERMIVVARRAAG
jgi:SAM-dependent methyltransferase